MLQITYLEYEQLVSSLSQQFLLGLVMRPQSQKLKICLLDGLSDSHLARTTLNVHDFRGISYFRTIRLERITYL